KTERNDARGIAQMMRVGLYRPVHADELNSGRDVGRPDLFDYKAIFPSPSVGRPPTIPLFVASVVPPKPRRIELRHRHRVFPNFETWLQRAACGDITVVIERHTNDLKHATIAHLGLATGAIHIGPLQEFDSALRPERVSHD